MLWWGASFRLLKEVKLVQGCAHNVCRVSCCEVTRCCHPKVKADAGMDRRRSRRWLGQMGCAWLAM